LPADKISVKPNFVDVSEPAQSARKNGLFVGRLSQEKGISVLLNALDRLSGLVLDVVGMGPEETTVAAHRRVHHHGWQEQPAVLEMMRAAAYLIFPSICYEAFPRTLIEAFACGLPVIASRLGAMAEIIDHGRTGLLFQPRSAEDLARKISWAESNPAAMREMGMNARREHETKYAPHVNYQQLMTIYTDAIAAVLSQADGAA
jgi:glycosyltransferase involved in cell wall biosynthesis